MINPADTEPDDDPIAIRQLALVDRIIGLEAEIANLRSVNLSREVRTQVDLVKSSTTWRVGSAVLAPVFLVKRVLRRGSKGASGK